MSIYLDLVYLINHFILCFDFLQPLAVTASSFVFFSLRSTFYNTTHTKSPRSGVSFGAKEDEEPRKRVVDIIMYYKEKITKQNSLLQKKLQVLMDDTEP